MRNPDFIERLCRRLVELGCPLAQVRRLVREVADHREDLKQAALAEGLSGPGAEARTDVQLGDPLYLAERLMAAQRRSSWWGRHYVVAFGLLPVLAFPVLWLLLLLLQMVLAFALGYGWDEKKLDVAVNDPMTFQYVLMAFQFIDYVAVALVAFLFCWLARRAAVSLNWMVTACAVCSFLALFTWGKIEPHSFFVGFTADSHLHLQWLRGAIPLAVAGAIYVFQRRTTRRFQEQVPA